ncbi:acetylcholine receptor subunit alpha-1-B-like [Rhopilema esculentum]|uniref:acetylcholine receptor subunit alpha-1-B-like n=1 Tax=Rhopilema esculentum TaxID=499914 RepID=UPI0031D53D6A
MHTRICILWLFLVLFLIFGTESKDDDELRLLDDLFVKRKYNKQVRPVDNKDKPLKIQFGIAYVQLVGIDDKEQMMVSNIWVRQKWNNTHLKWDPKKYGGIKSINVDPINVWLPDIVLYNNAKKGHDSLTMYKFKTKVILSSNGENKWYAPTIIRSGCSIDITYFPFDHQQCKLQFGSWTYTGEQVDIESMDSKVDLNKYLNSSQFKLISATATRYFTKYGCCLTYPYIDFVLHFKRQPGFFLFNVIIPSLVITCFAILTFSSPHLTGERVGLAIESFLSLSFLCLMVAGSIPINSDVTPLITKFLLMCMAMISMAVLFNLVSMNLLQSQAIPPLVRFIFFHVLGPIVGVCEGRNKGLQKRRKSILIKEQGARVLSYLDRTTAAELGNDTMSAASLLQSAHQTPSKQPSMPYKRFQKKNKPTTPTNNAMDVIMSNVDELVKRSHIEAITLANKDFWRCVAQTLDRIFLISFFLSFIFVSAVMLLKGFGHHIK